MNFGFKTYKTQYEEASAEVASLKKLNGELTEKVTSLEKLNSELSAKTVEQLISKEDLDKLMNENTEANKLVESLKLEGEKSASTIKELTTKFDELKAKQSDIDELVARETQSVLASVGIDRPFVVSEAADESSTVMTFKSGAKATIQYFNK